MYTKVIGSYIFGYPIYEEVEAEVDGRRAARGALRVEASHVVGDGRHVEHLPNQAKQGVRRRRCSRR